MQTPAPAAPLDTLSAADAAGAIYVAPDSLDPSQRPRAQTETPSSGIPSAEPVGLERQMVQADKLYVVLAVVLVIWAGLLLFLFRTDRRLARLERDLPPTSPPHDS